MQLSLKFVSLTGSLLMLCATAAVSAVRAAPPVPFYNNHVIGIERIGSGSIVIRTKDDPATVYAWYRANLRQGNGDTLTDDGARILYTLSGTTIDIEPGSSFAPGTNIGIVWDAGRYGAYPDASRRSRSAPKRSQ